MLRDIFKKTEEKHKKQISKKEQQDAQFLDATFAGLAEAIKRTVPKIISDEYEDQYSYLIEFPRSCGNVARGRTGLVSGQVNYYAHNLDKKDLSNSLIVKSEGFLELHRVCKENDYCLQIRPREVGLGGFEKKPAQIEIKFSAQDHYADSTDANFWENKSPVVAKPLAPKGRKLREGQKPNPPKDWYNLKK